MFKEEKKSPDPAEIKKEERDKHNALLAGVIFFMLLIIILWVMNLGMIFKNPAPKSSDLEKINQLNRDFQKAFSDAGAKMGALRNIDTAELQKYSSQLTATSTNGTSTIKK